MKIEQLLFCDQSTIRDFLPFTFTRPSAELRAGILTFAERWQRLLGVEKIAYNTADYLSGKYPKSNTLEGTLSIYANFLPTPHLLEQLRSLKVGESIAYQGRQLAFMNDGLTLSSIPPIEWEEPLVVFEKPTDLFTYNDKVIDFDFELLTKGRTSAPLSSTNGFLGDKANLFVEEGAKVEFATLNCQKGKIYIGKDAEVMEGSHLRGSIALCEHATVNMGAKLYGATTIGPYSKVGGEISNSVIWGYSNKGHDGFLGNSVLGQWCNLGADTNVSNLKNTYNTIQLWDYQKGGYTSSGLQFCGVLMGDHSKTAINTQINSGTTIGVFANLFSTGFPSKYIPNFAWGASAEKYRLDEAFAVAERVMVRRGIAFDQKEQHILQWLFDNQ
ncbi:GlmU family protein [uncultured Capnocytophaga sp.]|uniref:GlmU family protein n=1 Tax=uncultured Capnocytophaga sp. TaxID=159273 RepID=UPI00262FF79F|nr:GlmU family protein [uncultured Capnocytophaga sp.]